MTNTIPIKHTTSIVTSMRLIESIILCTIIISSYFVSSVSSSKLPKTKDIVSQIQRPNIVHKVGFNKESSTFSSNRISSTVMATTSNEETEKNSTISAAAGAPLEEGRTQGFDFSSTASPSDFSALNLTGILNISSPTSTPAETSFAPTFTSTTNLINPSSSQTSFTKIVAPSDSTISSQPTEISSNENSETMSQHVPENVTENTRDSADIVAFNFSANDESNNLNSSFPSYAPSVAASLKEPFLYVEGKEGVETSSSSTFQSATPSFFSPFDYLLSKNEDKISIISQQPKSDIASKVPNADSISTEEPSLFPSTKSSENSVSFLLSNSPSLVLSGKPSVQVSSIPTNEQTRRSTNLPSLSPTITSNSPSNKPSSFPTQHPSTKVPSSIPTILPSQEVTTMPSVATTKSPSIIPSQRPTQITSKAPSQNPSKLPSLKPSITPSVQPTLKCHDDKNYINPVSKQPCFSHVGLDCSKFHIFGLSEGQILELIHSCPVSCNIDCGTYSSFPTSIPSLSPSASPTIASTEFSTFVIVEMKFVPSLLNQQSMSVFETTSITYFSNIFESQYPGSTFLSGAKVTGQKVLKVSSRRLGSPMTSGHDSDPISESNFKLPPRAQRKLENENNIDIRVNTTITGETKLDDISLIQSAIKNAIVNPEFSEALRTNSHFFSAVSISASSSISNQIQKTQGHGGRSKGSTKSIAGILVGTVATIALVASFTGFFIFRRLKNRGEPVEVMSSPETLNEFDEGTSFDEQMIESECQSLSKSMATSEVASSNGFLTESKSSFQEIDCFHPSNPHREINSYNETNVKGTAPMSNENNYVKEIPPMIVIGNIDCVDDDGGSGSQYRQITPNSDIGSSTLVHHVDATPDIAAVLSMKKQGNTKRPLSDMLSGLGAPKDKIQREIFQNDFHLIKSLASSSQKKLRIDQNDESSKKLVYSGNETEAYRRSLRRSKKASSESSPHRKIMKGHSWKSDVSASSIEVDSGYYSHGDSGSIMRRSRKSTIGTASSQKTRRMTKFSKQDQIETYSDVMSEDKNSIGSMPAIKTTNNHSSRRNYVLRKETLDFGDQSVISGLTYSTTGGGSDSSTKVDVLAISGSRSSSHSPNHSRNDSLNSDDLSYRGFIYTFQAPSSGKLGIIIESSSVIGPTIHTVKDYSPLFGKVEKGDKLIEVDGESTANMSTQQVTNLLTRKRLKKSGRGTIKIKVMSITEKASRSYDSNSVSSTKGTIDTELNYRGKDKRYTSQHYFTNPQMNEMETASDPGRRRKHTVSHKKISGYTSDRSVGDRSMKSLADARQDSGLTSSSEMTYNQTDDEDLNTPSVASHESTDYDSFHLMAGGVSESDEGSESDDDEAVRHHYGAF